jgi:amino acid transporter
MASRRDQQVMVSEKVAPLLVARTLGSFDLVVIFVGIVLFITNSAGLQFAGPSAFVFWIVAFLTFLITGGFVTAQLGRMFPEEGSLYVWTHKVLGPFWGFFAGFVAWWPGPIVMMLAGILVATFLTQVGTFLDQEWLTENWQIGLVTLIVLWIGAGASWLRMRLTQNYVNLQFFFYVAAIFLMGFAGVIWLAGGNDAANTFAAAEWNPLKGAEGGIPGIPANLTFFSFAVLALLGIEVPLNMGVEISGGESAIRKYLFWGCIIVMSAYLWTTFGNMVTVPVAEVNGTTGGAQGVGVAMGDFMGIVVALILLWFFLTSSMVYNYSFARLLFVSGLEKRLPHQIGKVNQNKVPGNAVLLQTVLASIITIVIFFVLGSGEAADPFTPYFALLAGVTIVWCISTALLFLDTFFAKRANPTRFEEARRVPEGFLYLCGAVGTIANIVAVVLIFSGPWYPPGFETLAEWNTWMLVITVVSVVAAVAIYGISQVSRRGKADEELIPEVAEEVGAEVGGSAPMTSGDEPAG